MGVGGPVGGGGEAGWAALSPALAAVVVLGGPGQEGERGGRKRERSQNRGAVQRGWWR